MSAPMIEAAVLLSDQYPGMQFVAALANPNTGAVFRATLDARRRPEIALIDGRARTVMAAADVVICASGTATLEAMLVNRPMVVVYRLAPATYRLAKTLALVKSRFIALPNILAGEALVPELIQHEATGPRMAREAAQWLQDAPSCSRLKARFQALHRELLCDASRQAARAIAELMSGSC